MKRRRWEYENTIQRYDETPRPPSDEDTWELVAVTDAGAAYVALFWKRELLDE